MSNNNSFISKNWKVVSPLGGKLKIFSSSGFDIQSGFDYRTSKMKLYSVRALKSYLNEKYLIHGWVTATISKFSASIFQTYLGINSEANKNSTKVSIGEQLEILKRIILIKVF